MEAPVVCWWRQPSVGVAVRGGVSGQSLPCLRIAGKVLPSGLDCLLDRTTTHTLCCFLNSFIEILLIYHAFCLFEVCSGTVLVYCFINS